MLYRRVGILGLDQQQPVEQARLQLLAGSLPGGDVLVACGGDVDLHRPQQRRQFADRLLGVVGEPRRAIVGQEQFGRLRGLQFAAGGRHGAPGDSRTVRWVPRGRRDWCRPGRHSPRPGTRRTGRAPCGQAAALACPAACHGRNRPQRRAAGRRLERPQHLGRRRLAGQVGPLPAWLQSNSSSFSLAGHFSNWSTSHCSASPVRPGRLKSKFFGAR